MDHRNQRRFNFSLKSPLWLVIISSAICYIATYRRLINFTEYGRYIITVDYYESLESMLSDLNLKPDRLPPSGFFTSKNFPNLDTGKKTLEVVIVKFEKGLQTLDVLRTLRRKKLRPANLREIIALAKKYPELPGEYPNNAIVAPGFKYQNPGNKAWYVPILIRYSDGQGLFVDECPDIKGGVWYSSVLFMAIQE